MVKSYGGNVQAGMWSCAGGYVVVAFEIILSTVGTGGTHPHPHSHSQWLDNIRGITKIRIPSVI